MTQQEYDKRLEELEAEADRCGCCVVPAKPLDPPGERRGTGKGRTRNRPAARPHSRTTRTE